MWGWEEFRDRPDLRQLRESITGMFFKNLTAPAEDIHAVARTGLQLIVSYQKLPKELLQNSLRPLLQNLATYHKLHPAMLQVGAVRQRWCGIRAGQGQAMPTQPPPVLLYSSVFRR